MRKPVDPRTDILNSISINTSAVMVASSPLVFVCGGPTDVTLPTALTMRDELMRCLSADSSLGHVTFTMPEQFKDWSSHSVYPNLKIFESHIGQISSLIVIVLESEGSIAELGLFTENETLNRKITVFVEDEHYSSDSFIKHGPLSYLSSIDEKSVCSYPWKGALSTEVSSIAKDIKCRLLALKETAKFSSKNEGHVAYLIFEFIKVFRALRLSEITDYLKIVGIAVAQQRVKSLLYLLEKFELVAVRRRSHVDYYYAISNDQKINLGGKIDVIDAKVVVTSYYNESAAEDERRLLLKSLEIKK